jgi:hypothetical protein
MVAMFGWIIPEPFAIPPTLTGIPAIFNPQKKLMQNQL